MQILTIAQIVVSILIIILILLQERSSAGGAGGIFGGVGEGGFYQTRRGLEKLLFAITIILTVIFAALALLNLII